MTTATDDLLSVDDLEVGQWFEYSSTRNGSRKVAKVTSIDHDEEKVRFRRQDGSRGWHTFDQFEDADAVAVDPDAPPVTTTTAKPVVVLKAATVKVGTPFEYTSTRGKGRIKAKVTEKSYDRIRFQREDGSYGYHTVYQFDKANAVELTDTPAVNESVTVAGGGISVTITVVGKALTSE